MVTVAATTLRLGTMSLARKSQPYPYVVCSTVVDVVPSPNPSVCLTFGQSRQERLKFWSDPDTELKLAKETGISVFRMGIDWTRVMPKEPIEDLKSSVSIMNLLYISYGFSEHLYTLSLSPLLFSV